MSALPAAPRPRDANAGVPRRSRAWRDLVDRVLAELNALDPYGREPGTEDGAPGDEYELEAVPMVSQLVGSGAITAAEVDSVWTTWFGEPLSSRTDPVRFEAFVVRLNDLDPA